MNDDGLELGWRDPAVIIGAVALVAVFVGVVIAVVTGQLHTGSGSTPSSSTSRWVVPSGSARLTPPGEMPYPNCEAAHRDGRYRIHVGDPAFNPALDRNHDGIAC